MANAEVVIAPEVTVVEIQPLEYEVTVTAVGAQGPPGPEGPEGPEGPQGPPGTGGSGGTAEVFTQNSPQTTWNITHTLGYSPNVTIVDSGGNVVEGDIQYVDITTIVATFSSAFSGTAYLS